MAYRVFSLTWPLSIQIYIIGTKESIYVRKEFNPRGLVWNTNMAAVTSCENAVYVGEAIGGVTIGSALPSTNRGNKR